MPKHKYQVTPLYGAFFLSLVLCVVVHFAVGKAITKWQEGDRNDALELQSQLRLLETGAAESIVDIGAAKCAASARTLLQQNPGWGLPELFNSVGGVTGDAVTLKRMAPNVDWDLFLPLTWSGCRTEITKLAQKYPVVEALRGTATPSKDVVIPAVTTAHGPGYHLGFWIFWSWVFLLLGITKIKPENTHVIRHAPIGNPFFLAMVTLAAPATVTVVAGWIVVLALVAVHRADIPWIDAARGAVRWVRTVGYRTRLLRKLPPPGSVPYDGPAADAADTHDAVRWYALDPKDFLGREHLARRTTTLDWRIHAPIDADTILVPFDLIGTVESALELRGEGVRPRTSPTDVSTVMFREYPGDCGEIRIDQSVPRECVDLLSTVLSAVSEGTGGTDFACGVEPMSHESDDEVHVRVIIKEDLYMMSVEYPSLYNWTMAGNLPVQIVQSDPQETNPVFRDSRGTPVGLVHVSSNSIFLRPFLEPLLAEPWAASALARMLYDGLAKLQSEREKAERKKAQEAEEATT